ncbi:MAG TPA: respiratory nitrate reductase subunit gamma, partial [Anaerolineales bacterium]|nr:respiratory nitrate reductase subunit gamma [Anaerolineales bacterium]
VSGVITATSYRFGSYWFAAIFAPYLASIFTLRPQPLLLTSLPWVIQLHALNFFILLAVFPFSRLVHIITYPLGYLIRPWQIVVRVRKMRPVEGENL